MDELISRLGIFSIVVFGIIALWRVYLQVQNRTFKILEDTNVSAHRAMERQVDEFSKAMERMSERFEEALRLREERRSEQMERFNEVLIETANTLRRIGDGIDELRRRP
jgi:hypothetical protein